MTECALVPIRTCRNRCLGGAGGKGGQSEEEDIEEQLRTGGIEKWPLNKRKFKYYRMMFAGRSRLGQKSAFRCELRPRRECVALREGPGNTIVDTW